MNLQKTLSNKVFALYYIDYKKWASSLKIKEKLDQIKKEVESELRISYDEITKSNDHVLKDKWNKLWQKKYFKLIKENEKVNLHERTVN